MSGRLYKLVNKVSKWPATASFRWDERVSGVAFVLFHAVTLLRLLFPLQWLKFLYRSVFGKDRYFQKRTNFHPQLTELYFIGVLALLWGMSFLPLVPWAGVARQWAGYYFAAESVLWAAYYLFFRHFIERNFTIYHNAEYFLGFALALVVQVVGVALATYPDCGTGLGTRALQTLGYLFNSSIEVGSLACAAVEKGAISNVLALLGVLYAVLLLANLRDAFPKTLIKPATSVGVIGAGDVVASRLLPALVKPLPRVGAAQRSFEPVEIDPRAIQVYDVGPGTFRSIPLAMTYPNGRTRERHVAVKREQNSRDVVVEIAASLVPTIVASPPDSHYYYITLLTMHGVRFAVEKPITVVDPEIRALEPGGGNLFANGFAMSYYGLEKALPLTYLFSMHPMHRNHLDLYVSRLHCEKVDTLPWNEVLGSLGAPKCIRVFLLEGASRSPSADSEQRRWTENPHLGGLHFETSIHALTVLQKVLGTLSGFEPTLMSMVSRSAVRNDTCSFSRMQVPADTSHPGRAQIDLLVGKYMPEPLCARGVIIEYEKATVCCNFDAMLLHVAPRGATLPVSDIKGAMIAVREPYAQVRYALQASLIRAFFEYGWLGPRFDDYDTQYDVLRWLNDHRAALLDCDTNMPVYEPDGSGLPGDLAALVAGYRQLRPVRENLPAD